MSCVSTHLGDTAGYLFYLSSITDGYKLIKSTDDNFWPVKCTGDFLIDCIISVRPAFKHLRINKSISSQGTALILSIIPSLLAAVLNNLYEC